MEITICGDDSELKKQVGRVVENYFLFTQKIQVHYLSQDELIMELQKKSYFCETLVMVFSAENVEKTIRTIREVKERFSLFQLICVADVNNGSRLSSELFELNLMYYLYADEMERYLPKALKLLCERLKIMDENCIVCKSNHQLLKIFFEDIIYIEREQHTTKIQTKDGCYFIRRKLNELEEVLAKYPPLLRCHMSFYVNCNYAVAFGEKKFRMKSGEIIPVSRKYYQSVKDYIVRHNEICQKI